MKRLIALIVLAGCTTPAPKQVTSFRVEPTVQAPVKQTMVAKSRAMSMAAPVTVKGFTWPANPVEEQITGYQVWLAKSTGNVLVATVTETTYFPAKKGTYFLKAVNARGVGPKGPGVKDQ